MHRRLVLVVLFAFLMCLWGQLAYATDGVKTATERKAEVVVVYTTLGLGIWGVTTYAMTGGVYQLVTGSIWLYLSFTTLNRAMEGVDSPDILLN